MADPAVREIQMHVCAVCGRHEPVDIVAFVAGAQVIDSHLEWRCARHRMSPPQGHQWIDCPAAPHYGD